MLDTPQELFQHELRDIYDAENKLSRALETMAKKVPDETLSRGLREHRETTKQQIKRLEQVFQVVDKKPRREPCRGINGLIDEFSKFVSGEDPSEEMLNVFAVGAALKVEHYEIVAYQGLIRLADQLGLGEAIGLLEQNLAEEQETARQFQAIADGNMGPSSARSDSSGEPVAAADVGVVEEVAILEASEVAGLQESPE
jgi:ferritin-like metal-binding protein YciE